MNFKSVLSLPGKWTMGREKGRTFGGMELENGPREESRLANTPQRGWLCHPGHRSLATQAPWRSPYFPPLCSRCPVRADCNLSPPDSDVFICPTLLLDGESLEGRDGTLLFFSISGSQNQDRHIAQYLYLLNEGTKYSDTFFLTPEIFCSWNFLKAYKVTWNALFCV